MALYDLAPETFGSSLTPHSLCSSAVSLLLSFDHTKLVSAFRPMRCISQLPSVSIWLPPSYHWLTSSERDSLSSTQNYASIYSFSNISYFTFSIIYHSLILFVCLYIGYYFSLTRNLTSHAAIVFPIPRRVPSIEFIKYLLNKRINE